MMDAKLNSLPGQSNLRRRGGDRKTKGKRRKRKKRG